VSNSKSTHLCISDSTGSPSIRNSVSGPSAPHVTSTGMRTSSLGASTYSTSVSVGGIVEVVVVEVVEVEVVEVVVVEVVVVVVEVVVVEVEVEVEVEVVVVIGGSTTPKK